MSQLTGPAHVQAAQELLAGYRDQLNNIEASGATLEATAVAMQVVQCQLLAGLTHAVLSLTSATAANIRKNGATSIGEEWVST